RHELASQVPLSAPAQEETRTMLLPPATLLSPADGSPVVAPTQDMVLGCYYLTMDGPTPKRNAVVRGFGSEDEAIVAYELGARGIDQLSSKTGDEDADGARAIKHHAARVALHELVDVAVSGWDPETDTLVERQVRTTVGRILFNRILPDQMRYK